MLLKDEDLIWGLSQFRNCRHLALDTETYGLGWMDRLFSIALSSGTTNVYLNFNDRPDHLGAVAKTVLDKEWALQKLDEILFNDTDRTWFIHNAKFDMRRLDLEGLKIDGVIHCTENTERVLTNDHLTYSLDACAKRRGLKKSDAVEKYISKHKLYEWVEIPGKLKREKNKRFSEVPFEIMWPYAEQDAKICYEIGMDQLAGLN